MPPRRRPRWRMTRSFRRFSIMASRANGAGSRVSGVLERTAPPSSPVEGLDQVDGETPARKAPAPPKKTGKRIKGHTIYLPDDLFERILVAAHRREKTISDYVRS